MVTAEMCQCPIRAFSNFYKRRPNITDTSSLCQCPIRAFSNFYMTKVNTDQLQMYGVNALYGPFLISTRAEDDSAADAESVNALYGPF